MNHAKNTGDVNYMKIVLLTLLAIVCICAAGSIGPWFPWINIIASSVFMFIGIKAKTS